MSYVKIKDNVYHIGDPTVFNGLDCNPYLILEGDEALLIDPGSPLDFEVVLKNLKALTELDRIKYIVLHHPDPDLCCSVPLLKKEGVNATIITSWRTMNFLQYYGIDGPSYLIEENKMEFVFKTGRTLEFIPTPYLHSSSAFATYDIKEKLLFSSDLFGAFSQNRTFYADKDYMDRMLSFHELYMPSNTVLRPVMDLLLTYPINMILPQHGSIIADNVKDYIFALRTLECGSMLAPLKKNLMKSGGYLMIFNEIYHRLRSLYPEEEVSAVFHSFEELVIDDSGEVTDYHSEGEVVLNLIFEKIKLQKGLFWIGAIEPFVRKLNAVYDIKLPDVFSVTIGEIASENMKLMEANLELNKTIRSVNEKLVKCPITGLYNEIFLQSLLVEELENEDWRDVGDIASVSIDNFSSYQLNYGSQEEEHVLNNLAYMFQEEFGDNSVFRLDYAEFGLYVKGYKKEDLIARLDKIRFLISKSNLFLGSLTISVGVAFRDEIQLDNPSYEITARNYLVLSLNRLRISKTKGKNMVYYQGEANMQEYTTGLVLLVDSDETNLELLKNFIGEEGMEVIIARDGMEAYEMALHHKPKVIISEAILNKMDGFVLREQLLQNSETKDIETIILSYKKDAESVERAMELGITYYLKKPYLLSELMGIIRRKVKGVGGR